MPWPSGSRAQCSSKTSCEATSRWASPPKDPRSIPQAQTACTGRRARQHQMLKAPRRDAADHRQGIRHPDRPFRERTAYLAAEVRGLPDIVEPGTGWRLCGATWSRSTRIIGMVPYLPDELEMAAASIEDPAVLGYFIASTTHQDGEKRSSRRDA